MFVRKNGEYSHIQCDAKGCETISPPAEILIANHGLRGMGWHCSGGKHFCPSHLPKKAKS